MSTVARVPVWDGWRGLAILLVLVGHFTFSKWVWEERMGVDVFFVLSGMLMSNILFVRRMALPDFYIRRISRIIPALVVFLLAALAISVALKYEFKLVEFVAALFFIRTYFPTEPEYFTSILPIGHLWSLSVEEHAYVAMSVMSIVFVSRNRAATALTVLFVASVLVNINNQMAMRADDFQISLIRTESAIGFIAFSAAYHLWRQSFDIRLPNGLPPLLLALSFLCYLEVAPIWLTYSVAPLFLGVAVNHIADSRGLVCSVLSFAPLRLLGVLSFSIYLWQQIFYKLYYALPAGQLTGFLLSIVIGAGSYYVIESPCRRFINDRFAPEPRYRT